VARRAPQDHIDLPPVQEVNEKNPRAGDPNTWGFHGDLLEFNSQEMGVL